MAGVPVKSMCRSGMHSLCAAAKVACDCPCHGHPVATIDLAPVARIGNASGRAIVTELVSVPSVPRPWPDPADHVPVPDRSHRPPAAMDERWPLAADWPCCTPRCAIDAHGWSATHATTCRKSTPATL